MSGVADPDNRQRFVDALAAVYDDVRREMQAGHKRTHWMWFIFPQLTALGRSATAKHYGIGSPDEARAYLGHPVLAPRLYECAQILVDNVGTQPIEEIMGPVDAMKLRSSMTLFLAAAEDGEVFQAVLDRYYGGQPDELTLELLRSV